jgi:hypothetical protein
LPGNYSNKNNQLHLLYQQVRGNMPLILLAITLFLFISKSLYNVPIAIMALIGLYKTIRSPRDVWDDQLTRLFIILFMCIWIPLLISLIDAVNISR